MDLTRVVGTISYHVSVSLEDYYRLHSLEEKRNYVLSAMMPLDIIGPNVARRTLLGYRDVVENIKSEKKLDEYVHAVIRGGQHYNPSKPKQYRDYKKKWCS